MPRTNERFVGWSKTRMVLDADKLPGEQLLVTGEYDDGGLAVRRNSGRGSRVILAKDDWRKLPKRNPAGTSRSVRLLAGDLRSGALSILGVIRAMRTVGNCTLVEAIEVLEREAERGKR